MKPCIPVVDILKMCMWVLVGLELNLTDLQPFELSHFWQLLHCRVWSLCNQLLLQFSIDYFETMHACCGYIEDVHVNFCRQKNNF